MSLNLEDVLNQMISDFEANGNPLNNMPTMEVLSRLEKYKKMDLKRVTKEELFRITMETIPCCNVGMMTYSSEMKFYRVREYFDCDYTDTSQLFYPPKEYVKKMGRLNNIGESMLYVSIDPVTPFHELKAEVDKKYTVICYKIKEGCTLTSTVVGAGTNLNDDGLTELGKVNSKIIDQFFYSEFTKDVSVGQEYLYKITNMLAENFFDLHECEAYEYPSVALNRNINLAIKPAAVDTKLEIVSVENILLKSITESEVHGEQINRAVNIGAKTVEYSEK